MATESRFLRCTTTLNYKLLPKTRALGLENDLQRKLDDAGFSIGELQPTETSRFNVKSPASLILCITGVEIGGVREVEEFPTELDGQVFLHWKLLDDAQIPGKLPRTVESETRESAQFSGARVR